MVDSILVNFILTNIQNLFMKKQKKVFLEIYISVREVILQIDQKYFDINDLARLINTQYYPQRIN